VKGYTDSHQDYIHLFFEKKKWFLGKKARFYSLKRNSTLRQAFAKSGWEYFKIFFPVFGNRPSGNLDAQFFKSVRNSLV